MRSSAPPISAISGTSPTTSPGSSTRSERLGAHPAVCGAEGERQQLAERDAAPRAGDGGEMDGRRGAGELGDALAAAAAGRHRLRRLGRRRASAAIAPRAAGDHRRDGRGLGADPFGIGRILDIGADIDASVLGAERGADREARIGRVGVGRRTAARRGDQSAVAVSDMGTSRLGAIWAAMMRQCRNQRMIDARAIGSRPWPRPMPSRAARDLRLDFFRGLSLFFIFIDHIPENVLAYFTLHSIAFCDAAEVFIFISGYTAALVYGQSLQAQRRALAIGADLSPRLAALRRAHLPVRDLHRRGVLHAHRGAEPDVHRGARRRRFPRARRISPSFTRCCSISSRRFSTSCRSTSCCWRVFPLMLLGLETCTRCCRRVRVGDALRA